LAGEREGAGVVTRVRVVVEQEMEVGDEAHIVDRLIREEGMGGGRG
jgi:hypothetical protein